MSINHIAGGQELLCINTEKVYDWVLNEATFDLNVDGLELPINTVTGAQLECDDIDLNSVTCEVTPAEEDSFVILDREDQVFIIDEEEVTLQLVNIRKCFDVIVYAQLIPELGGGAIEIGTATFSRCEQVILCAPEGTDINVSYTDLNCFVCAVNCDTGTTTEIDELNVTLTVRLCQSIQSTFEVTIELEADFCQPRDVLPVPPCPAPTIPVQCPVVFPTTEPNGEISKKKKHGSSKKKAVGMMLSEQQPEENTNIIQESNEIAHQEPEIDVVTSSEDLTNEEQKEGEE
ncbi:BMQ_0737 family morphogenetic spore coat protein [Gracilibacillus salitolerans]|uniref:hypothetical protein n=1 Tax=Gracilibacillus salitolerans TaxID=2663022 RepID=UPI001E600036|nr:hypothetical protein [Gracilibacillus salitolerans]